MDKTDIKNLKKRYLLWLYKTTKEAFDRIERKFTQLEIDKFMLKEIKKLDKKNDCGRHIREFEDYILNKEKKGLSQKYEKGNLKSDYSFLAMKLKGIERSITKELGNNSLKEIKALYENEMNQRILKSTEH
ncbi:MAG: hypothetical protein PHE18_04170 [Candidatus Omnitrophica bacterium]|nr:hypothetical protein [Candidatus Omnitrophota bacterium]MDD5553053.1 hypothetical protein [Candidatus Omnitrophota bacterium]